jgi:ubiquinone/menaquinone biosynthesis C-methylase UbiE
MTLQTTELITDELDLLRRLVPLPHAKVIELGCGKADMAKRLMDMSLVASVTALEVDCAQLARNIENRSLDKVRFIFAGAEAIPFPDDSFHVALMLKSLHHVPLNALDRALEEIRRVLQPGGYLYVSEPVYAGDFNDIVRLFHDEKVERAAAYAALRRAVAKGDWEEMEEKICDVPLHFKNFDDFVERIVRVTHSDLKLDGEILREVEQRFARFMSADGAHFIRQMRINVLRKPD